MSGERPDSVPSCRAAVLDDGTDRLDVVTGVELDDPGPNEVLVTTVASGLCHSDLHVLDGTLARPRPLVLGHEGAGVVDAVGADVGHLSPGDHVVTCLVTGCGFCPQCRAGVPTRCSRPEATRRGDGQPPRLVHGSRPLAQMGGVGSLADKMLMDARGVVAVPRTIPLELAAILGCAVVTGLGAVFNVARVGPTESVAVVGCGGIGLNIVQGARIAGAARIIAADLVASKLDLARELGATHTVDASSADPVEAVAAISGGGVDHAFEAVGRPPTVEQALAMAAPGRAAYIVGILPDDASVSVPGSSLRRGKSLVGVFMGATRPHDDIPRYVDLWAQGRLDLETMVSRYLPLEEVNEGFDALAAGEVARAVVRLDQR